MSWKEYVVGKTIARVESVDPEDIQLHFTDGTLLRVVGVFRAKLLIPCPECKHRTKSPNGPHCSWCGGTGKAEAT